MLPFIFFILMYISLIPLSYSYYISNSLFIVIFKFMASLCFVLCSYFSHKKANFNQKYFSLFFTAFIFCLIGDTFLAMGKDLLFIIGTIAFALGHIFFIFSYTSIAPIKSKDIITFLCIYVPITLFITFYTKFNFHNLLPLILTYSVLVSFMYSKAISFYRCRKENKPAVILTIAGASLFVISDLLLLFIYFINNPPAILKLFNIILYYSGQGILSLSLLYPFIRKIDELIKIKEL